jgi:hypothetical protein
MGWEWHRRLQLAEAGRMGRTLRGWEGADRVWEKRVMRCKWILRVGGSVGGPAMVCLAWLMIRVRGEHPG